MTTPNPRHAYDPTWTRAAFPLRLLGAAALVLLALGARAGAVLTTLHSFQVFTNAAYPEAGLMQGSDGYLYGTTEFGGMNGGYGSVFKITTNGMLTILYSFTGGNDGAYPEAGLVQGSDGCFYGTTKYGGTTNYNDFLETYGYGTVFKISASGTLTSLYSFTGDNNGAYPEAGLVQGSDGNFYGTTYGSLGGPHYGTVFEISPQGAFTSLYSFAGTSDGANPKACVVQGGDGFFYGTTFLGGASGFGTVFKISTNGALTTLYSFTGVGPFAGLVQGRDGYFYGTTAGGSVFKISTNGALTTLYSFFIGDDGDAPEAGLVQGSDGYFYGTTWIGGSGGGYPGYGTVFKISPQGAFSSLYSFAGGNDGANPLAGLVQGSDGYFYGTASLGGTQNGPLGYGTVFKISPQGAFTSLYSFIGDNDGAHPAAGLLQGNDGFFYGTTSGSDESPLLHPGNGYGTVFKISAKGALSNLYSFGSVHDSRGPLDGAYPSADLVQGSDGYLYGTTIGGMAEYVYSLGTVFRISTNGALTTLVVFGTNSVEGAYPVSVLAQGADGFFYGTTEFNGYTGGGSLGYYVGDGTVFKISTNGTLTTLYAFGTVTNAEGWPLDGAGPNWLARGSDGLIYGTTEGGGENDDGSVFQISGNGALNSLYSFSGGDGGAFGLAHLDGLVQGSNGFFYGTTYFGGANGDGIVFKFSTNGMFSSLYSFGTVTNASGDPLDGANPVAGLVQGSDGNFYGATQEGGTYNAGSLFQISSNGTLTTLYSFTGANDGAYPEAGLVQGSDGSFYGTTYGDGQGGAGTVFRLTIVPEIQAATLTNNIINLAWSTEAGGVYQLQYTSDLISTNWTSLGNAVIATGSSLSIMDSVTNAPQRFYRLSLSP